MKLLFTTILLLLLSSINYTQDFGDDYEQYLKMEKFDQEPDADILIIFDRGHVKITDDFDLQVKRHTRIKILTEEGKEYANVKIPYWHEDEIYDLDAASYNSNGDEYELESENVFDEGTEKYKIKSVAIPGVEVGSVIEYEYTLLSEYITSIKPWFFQHKNYTLLSEYSLTIPPGFIFNKVDMNITSDKFSVNSQMIRDISNPRVKVKLLTWTGRDLPGIKNEPYIDNLSDQYAQLLIIFNAYKSSYQNITYAKTWDSIAERLNKGYSNILDDEIDLPKDLEEIVNGKFDVIKKVGDIYTYISTKIETEKNTGIYASSFNDFEDILENRSGTSNEKNMLLINLYRRLGLKANPVLISTRSNGRIIPEFVSPAQFNRIICSVELNKKKYFLYTGSRFNPFGYLITSYNVPLGFEITDDTGKIIKLNPRKYKNKTNIETKGELTEDGILNLVSTITYTGYPAYNSRVSMEDEDLSEWFATKVETIYETAEVDTFFIEDPSINDPLKLTIHYSIPEYVEESDDLIFFTPPLFTNLEKNVFVREERSFPVSFNYKNNTFEKCTIELQKNISVSDLPEKKKINIKNNSYTKMYTTGDNFVQIIMTNNRKKRTFSQGEYQNLKNFYEKRLEYDSEQIVLNKSTTTAEK